MLTHYAEPMAGLPADDVLLERLRTGDESAFALVLDGWSGGMLRLARSFVSTEESAAERINRRDIGLGHTPAGSEGRTR